MADKKISALPSATTPLAGTEVLPIVQSGVTDQVSVANLTIGRDVAVKKLNPTDNVVMAAGKGIDFAANGGDVLTQYDEGTWNPTVGSGSGTITSYTATGTYTRVGRQVTLAGEITITNNGTGASDIRISGLPFAAASVNFAGVGVNGASGATVGVTFAATNTLIMFKYDGTYPVATGQQILFNVTYFV